MFYNAQLTQEGERWLVEFPDCPGCQTFGDSREHALTRAQEALEGWLETILDLRRVPPRPTAKDGIPVYIDDKLSIALQLRLAREELGLSQTEVAARAGLSQQQIARLENPDNNPTLQGVSAAARALGLRLELVPGPTVTLDLFEELKKSLDEASSGDLVAANAPALSTEHREHRRHGTR